MDTQTMNIIAVIIGRLLPFPLPFGIKVAKRKELLKLAFS